MLDSYFCCSGTERVFLRTTKGQAFLESGQRVFSFSLTLKLAICIYCLVFFISLVSNGTF